MLCECSPIYGECAHQQHVRRTLTLTHAITAYSVSGNVVRVRILICATRQKPCRKRVYHGVAAGATTTTKCHIVLLLCRLFMLPLELSVQIPSRQQRRCSRGCSWSGVSCGLCQRFVLYSLLLAEHSCNSMFTYGPCGPMYCALYACPSLSADLSPCTGCYKLILLTLYGGPVAAVR